jgi:hypothetical protein
VCILNLKNSFDDFGAFEVVFGLEFLDELNFNEVMCTLEFESKQKNKVGLHFEAPSYGSMCLWLVGSHSKECAKRRKKKKLNEKQKHKFKLIHYKLGN